ESSNENTNKDISAPSTFSDIPKPTLTAYRDSEILLRTVKDISLDKNNRNHVCRVLIDSSSQTHFITHRLTKRLDSDKHKINLSLSGLGQLKTSSDYSVTTRIRSISSSFETKIKFLALPVITGLLPLQRISPDQLSIPVNIKLADPNFFEPREIDALIGNTLFYDLLNSGQVKLANSSIILQNTLLGWIVTDEIKAQQHPTQRRAHKMCHLVTSLDDQLSRFWSIEETPEKQYLYDEEASCERHFVENVSRDSQGRCKG
ncbi:PREDICTED: uncharacterized protein LOC108554497, partial [Eufriesea mexicana]|uniref:uncharacterized protein LOC108554497 n=1 Tax=Eufriesea mexicana TaxID=516756 RepID=UPI00083BC33E